MIVDIKIPYFQRELNDFLEYVINYALVLAKPEVEKRIKEFLRLEFLKAPETTSLIAGKLKADFGLEDGEVIVGIIDWIIDKIEVNIIPYKRSGGFKIKLAVFELDEITSLPDASYINDVNIITLIDWLNWLLSYGSKIIIRDYEVKYTHNIYSRSKMALMRKGKGWRVPPEFAGTISNNWITRTVESNGGYIEFIMEDEFLRALEDVLR